jgi:hypothetical protein
MVASKCPEIAVLKKVTAATTKNTTALFLLVKSMCMIEPDPRRMRSASALFLLGVDTPGT